MSTKVIAASLTLDAQAASTSVKSFKQQLREANNELISISVKFGETSKEAAAAAKNVANLRDRIDDAKKLSEAFNPDAKFQAFGGVLRTAAGGFAALTGAMALFGDQSEDVQKTLLKVQGALALSEGLSAIGSAGKSFGVLKVAALDAFTAIKGAIGATGIGLLLIAVGAIYEYWDNIKDALTGVNNEQSKTLDLATKAVAKEKEKLSHLDDQDNILKMQGKSEKQILEFKEKQVKEAIAISGVQLQAQKDIEKHQVETAQRNHDILAGIINFTLLPLKLVTSTIDSVLQKVGINSQLTKGLDKGVNALTNVLFDPAATKKKADATIKETQDGITKLKDQYAGYQVQIKAINKEALAKERAFQSELKALRDASGNALITDADILAQKKLKQDYDNQRIAIQQEVHTKAQRNELLKALDEKYQNESHALTTANLKKTDEALAVALKEQADKKKKAEAEQLNNFKNSGAANIQAVLDINNEIATSQLDTAGQQAKSEMDQLNKSFNEKMTAVKGNKEAELALEKEYEQLKTKITENENNARLSIVANVLGQAADLFGRATAAGKALAVAQATIDTYQSATASYKSLAGIPVVGPALGFAAAAIAVAAGLANVKKILTVQVPGGGSAGAAPSIGSGALPPLTPRPDVGNTQLPQNQINQIGNAANPVRAFVLESDVTSSQSRISRLNRAARLGS